MVSTEIILARTQSIWVAAQTILARTQSISVEAQTIWAAAQTIWAAAQSRWAAKKIVKIVAQVAATGVGLMLFKSRMKINQSLAQIISVEMGINFGSGDAFMPQHFLHSP